MLQLTNEQPILLMPELAIPFGVKGAVILLLLHQRLREQGQRFEEKSWYCQSYDHWYAQLPFLRKSTIKRQLLHFEALEIIQASDRFNVLYVDRTKWYTINYEMLRVMTGITKSELDSFVDQA